MWGTLYVCLTWMLVALGCGLLAYGLTHERRLRSRVGLALVAAVGLIAVCAVADSLSVGH